MQYTWEDNLDASERKKRYKQDSDRSTKKYLRSNWYDRDEANLETVAHDNIRLFSDIADEFLTEKLVPATKNHIALAVEWENIIGKDLAMVLGFADLQNGVLFLEIKHPAYLQDELMETADLIIDRVNNKMQSKVCSEIKFVPKGRKR